MEKMSCKNYMTENLDDIGIWLHASGSLYYVPRNMYEDMSSLKICEVLQWTSTYYYMGDEGSNPSGRTPDMMKEVCCLYIAEL